MAEPIPVPIRGVVYPSIRAASDDVGVTETSIRRAMRRGTLDNVGMGRSVGATWRGVKMPTLRLMGEYLGYNYRWVSEHVIAGTLDSLEPREGSPAAEHMPKQATHDAAKSPPPRLKNSPISEADHRARWRAWRDGLTAPEACARIEDETGAACKQASYAGWMRAYGLRSRASQSSPERARLREVRYERGVESAARTREMSPPPPTPPQTSGPALTWIKRAALTIGRLPAPLRAMPRTEAEAVMAREFVEHHLGLLQAARAAKAKVTA